MILKLINKIKWNFFAEIFGNLKTLFYICSVITLRYALNGECLDIFLEDSSLFINTNIEKS